MLRTTLSIVAAILLVLVAAPPARASPPVLATSVQPVDAGGAVLVEHTAAEFSGGPEGWRMNVDIWLENQGPTDLHLDEVRIAYSGGSDPADLVINTTLLEAFTGYGVIPADPDNSIPSNEIPAGMTRIGFIPEPRVSPFPVPDSVTLELVFGGFAVPISVTRPLVEYASPYPLGSYAFVGGAKDLPAGQYWFSGRAHTFRSPHRQNPSQRYAEDWAIVRWDGSTWTQIEPGGSNTVNEDFLIWERPIYAIADGQVVRCANGFPDNTHPGAPAPEGTPGGGNHLWIRHATGERVLYAHFREGAIPEALCPADGAPEHEVPNGPFVSAGQFLGRAGSSGASSAPHFHIHSQMPDGDETVPWEGVPLLYHNIRSFEEDWFDPNSDPAPPWNIVTHAAVSSHDPDPDIGVLIQPLPRANVGVEKWSAPTPAVAGTSITSTVKVTNHGPEAASNVLVTDFLPNGLDYVSDTGGCVEVIPDELDCALGAMAQQSSSGTPDVDTFSIISDIAPDLVFDNGGPVTADNALEVMHTDFDDSVDDDAFIEHILVLAEADLRIVSFEVASAPPDVLIGEDAEVVVEAVVTSDGPSSPMHANLALTGSTDGVATTPVDAEVFVPALEDGELRTVEATFTLSCEEPGQQTADLEGEITPALPDDTDPDLTDNDGKTSVTVECVVPVAINVKPGGSPNAVNVNHGTIPVAVLTTEAGEYNLPLGFDATSIFPLSVRFGDPDLVWTQAGGAAERHGTGHVQDSFELDESTKDGDADMLLHFEAVETGLTTASTEGCVRGLFDGGGDTFAFFGCDAVSPVPP